MAYVNLTNPEVWLLGLKSPLYLNILLNRLLHK